MSLQVKDATGTTRSVETLPSVGRAAAASSLPSALSTEDLAALQAIKASIDAALAGTQPISAVALPLPAGAATAALQSSTSTALLQALAATLTVSAASLPLPTGAATDVKSEAIRALLAGTIAVSAAALPLPAGAATSAKQDTMKASIDATASSTRWAAVTPSDSVAVVGTPKAIYCNTAGNVTVKGSDGTSAVFTVTAGQTLPIVPTYIMATGTTVTSMIAMF